ncbi:phage terminase small subunit P27 family [Mycolicibacterium palauense]|uniref:phage terminase small subunit P27 family n=1 Tax=Mycolicibacterium palauense TaxID=2034511 RepID=UPI000BFEB0E5|nr:phage terminase small subunit P27 family [Mycolicibacterium palauense]
MAAPTKRPAALLLLNGRSEGRDSGGRIVEPPPPFKRSAPAPPTWLSREAKAEWRRVIPELQRLDVIKPEDRASLAAYCETWARYVTAVRQYRAEGITLVNPESGRVHRHPAVAIAETAGTQLRAFAAEFGLTPASERNVTKRDDSRDDNETNPFSG